MHSMDNREKRELISKLKSEVNELHPLLEGLFSCLPNIAHVDYTHGNNEMGADFILHFNNDIFQSIDYIGVIAKLGQIKQDNVDIERQIDECIQIDRYIENGKKQIYLTAVWVVTTDTITENAKRKIHANHKSSKIKFISGSELVEIINKYLPYYWEDIDIKISKYLQDLLSKTRQIEKAQTLIPGMPDDFYIDQDIETKEDPWNFNKKKIKSYKINLQEKLLTNKAIIIEGSMGIGKSKLVRQIIYKYADGGYFKKYKILPVSIGYTELVDRYDCNISGAIENIVSKKTLDCLPQETTILLLVDGIDEKRTNIEEHLALFEKCLDNLYKDKIVNALFTTRDFGLFDSKKDFDNKYIVFKLQPLSTYKLITFIKLLCRELNLTSRLINDLKTSLILKELPRSPIAAILLAKLIKENPNELPSNITELYSKYLELALGRWDIDKGLQSQKEFDAAEAILKNIADYVMENELHYISSGEAKAFFENYLKGRNLEVDADSIYKTMVERSGIIVEDNTRTRLCFKHRTFAEFFYAKSKAKRLSMQIDDRLFQAYWFNVYYFYAGLLKDCPDILDQIMKFPPKPGGEQWFRMINFPNLLLAGYLSPYEVIKRHITTLIDDAAKLFYDVYAQNIESPFTNWPPVPLLFLFQIILKYSYSYKFFVEAIIASFYELCDTQNTKHRIYALLFISLIAIDFDNAELLDLFFQEFKNEIPIQIQYILEYEGENIKDKSKIFKKQLSNFKKTLRDHSGQKKNIISQLVHEPIKTRHKKK